MNMSTPVVTTKDITIKKYIWPTEPINMKKNQNIIII